MNSDNLTELLTKGFRVTLGAASSLVEILQDPEKRDENLTKLSSELNQLAQDLAEKGEVTEQEARNLVDSLLKQPGKSQSQETTTKSEIVDISATPAPENPPPVEADLQDLTSQIAALRAELEKLRSQDQSGS